MAPEQARGESDVDIRADIHGLGATLYQLLTNRLAYSGDHPMATLAKVVGPELPEIPEELPSALRAVLLRTLAKNPQDRHQSAHELREDLDCLINGGPPVHTEVPDDPAAMSGPQPSPVKARSRTSSEGPKEPPSKNTSKESDQRTASSLPHTSKKEAFDKTQQNHKAEAAHNPARTPHNEAVKPQAAHPAVAKKSTHDDYHTPPGHKTLEEDAEKYADCIYVAKDGLTAWINLATGAKFPRKPLEKLLRKLDVNYGIDENALIDATRIVNFPRRLILARGEETQSWHAR